MIAQRAPKFWNSRGVRAASLLPLSGLWWLASQLDRARGKPKKAGLPVICVGNLSVGGSGKTPSVLALCSLLAERGVQPVILSRGHGGSAAGPLRVDPAEHEAALVGDEPLLMAASFPVVVARQRAAGAEAIARAGLGDVIIMDDGLQNWQLHQDLKIAVFDGEVGVGNGWLLPAGPLRESLASGLERVDLVLFNGPDRSGLANRLPAHIPQITARLLPYSEQAEQLRGQRLFAFAGIGRPARFFQTLQDIGAELAGQAAFGDHHLWTEADLSRLSDDAHQTGAQLVTTHKDWVRLPSEWRERVHCLSVWLDLGADDQQRLAEIITSKTGQNVLS